MNLYSESTYITRTLNVPARGQVFAKPGEPMKKAISRFMAARKRAWHSPERRSFPQWAPGMSTSEYIQRWDALNPAMVRECGSTRRYIDMGPLSGPAPYYMGPEVSLEDALDAAEEAAQQTREEAEE